MSALYSLALGGRRARQSVSCSLYQSHGRNSLQQVSRSCNSVLELGSGEGHYPDGEAHCREGKRVSRSDVISRCLKTKDQQATLVLITPNWSAQPWFPVALMMSIDYPRCLPRQDNLLVATANADPPLIPTLPNLVAWLISGDPSWTRVFHQKLRSSCHPPGGRAPIRTMTLHGESGSSGASTNMCLPFLPL